MLFLQDQETPSQSISTIDSDNENYEEINNSTFDVSILLLYLSLFTLFFSKNINYSYNQVVLPWYFSIVVEFLLFSCCKLNNGT